MREYTNKFYDLCENGILEYEDVVQMCLKYMSEDDVKDMWEHNDLDD